jgi:hypothetical protein
MDLRFISIFLYQPVFEPVSTFLLSFPVSMLLTFLQNPATLRELVSLKREILPSPNLHILKYSPVFWIILTNTLIRQTLPGNS